MSARPFDLSHAQQSMWLIGLLTGHREVLTTQTDWHTNLDIDRLQLALDAMVARHDSLRVVFRPEGAGAKQVDLGSWRIPIDFVDLSGEPDPLRQSIDLITASKSALWVSEAPPVQFGVCKLGDGHFRSWLIADHLVADALSFTLFQEQLNDYYDAPEGELASLCESVELPGRYARFVAWEQAWLASARAAAAEEFWRAELMYLSEPALADLTTTAEGRLVRTLDFAVSPAHAAAAMRVAREKRTTPHGLLLGVYAAALGEVTGQRDVVIGVPFGTRVRKEFFDSIGLYVNPLAIRVSLDDNPSLDETIHRCTTGSLSAYKHGCYPFDLVVARVAPQRRDGVTNPIFQTYFLFSDSLGSMPPQVHVGLYGRSVEDGLQFKLHFDGYRISRARAEALRDSFVDTLAGLLRHEA